MVPPGTGTFTRSQRSFTQRDAVPSVHRIMGMCNVSLLRLCVINEIAASILIVLAVQQAAIARETSTCAKRGPNSCTAGTLLMRSWRMVRHNPTKKHVWCFSRVVRSLDAHKSHLHFRSYQYGFPIAVSVLGGVFLLLDHPDVMS